MNRSILGLLIMLVVGIASEAVAQDSVSLSVAERSGVDRINEYVNFGVPLPKIWNIIDANDLRLIDGTGIPVPTQFEALARWGGPVSDMSKPIKWVLVGFFTSLSSHSTQTFQLAPGGPGPSASVRIHTDTSTVGKLYVDTGAARFEINTDSRFNLLNQVAMDGRDLLQPLSTVEAIRYETAGGRSIVSGGTPDLTPRSTSVCIERGGDLYTVVRVAGSILGGASQKILDFTARYHFYAGSSGIRLDFTVENNLPVIWDEGGQPTNVHDQGGPNSVYIGSLKLALRPAVDELQVLTEQGVTVSAPSFPVRLYQDSSGTATWNAYVGMVGWESVSCTPRLQSYCTRNGFEITGPGVALSGSQALGWMSAGDVSGSNVTVAVRDFWQNFPKVIQTDADATLSLDLFPNGTTFNHNLRPGEEKTHTLLLHFVSGGMTATTAQNMALAFNSALFGTAPPSWHAQCAALGEVPMANLNQWPEYERYVRTAFEPNPDFGPDDDPSWGNTTLHDAIERYNIYGWQDYGDVPLDYEAFGGNQAGQMNLKYWYLYGMLTQFCRSGALEWLDLALPAAWHLADIDYLHIPDEGIQHWSHGAYFGHSAHDEPGCTNPNRNGNSPSVDLFFGVPDLILAYHLSGEQRFMDVAMEGLQAMENLMQFSDFTYPVFYRERANLIFAFLEGHMQTGDIRWRTAMRNILMQTAALSNKQGWLADPNSYSPPAGGPMGGDERISGFQFAQSVWTMGRYLDFCEEYGISDDLGVAQAVEAYGDFIINHLMKEIPEKPGSYATVDSIWFAVPYETYLETNNWALLMADVLAYAFKYSGRQQFLNMAAELYETGSENPAWLDSPPVYIASKDLVNALNWGLVYMNQSGEGSEMEWIPISGSVSYEGTPICTMVLANGQYMFTCDSNQGVYDLAVPLDEMGQITLFAFCDSLAPFKVTLTPSQAAVYDIPMASAGAESRQISLTYGIGASTRPGWVNLNGTATFEETPLNIMVLANGQYMFTPIETGAFSMEVPLDNEGRITLFCFGDGFQPYKQLIAP
ncbi:MAG: hypothetical protein ACOWYE_11070 [Desulfatiglandales bacterium]